MPTGRELAEVKSQLSALTKDMVSKITYEEVERLMLRFQKEVFMKMGESRSVMVELEARLGRGMEECRTAFAQQIAQHSAGKQERKIRKCTESVKESAQSVEKLGGKV